MFDSGEASRSTGVSLNTDFIVAVARVLVAASPVSTVASCVAPKSNPSSSMASVSGSGTVSSSAPDG